MIIFSVGVRQPIISASNVGDTVEKICAVEWVANLIEQQVMVPLAGQTNCFVVQFLCSVSHSIMNNSLEGVMCCTVFGAVIHRQNSEHFCCRI